MNFHQLSRGGCHTRFTTGDLWCWTCHVCLGNLDCGVAADRDATDRRAHAGASHENVRIEELTAVWLGRGLAPAITNRLRQDHYEEYQADHDQRHSPDVCEPLWDVAILAQSQTKAPDE
jgi:hypothetical protein